MKALTTILAAGFVFANGAIAADSQVAAAQASAPAAVQSVTITKTRSRADVQAEAAQAMKNHKTALAIQLEQYQ